MRCLSLFSGCGGLDLGLTLAGFEIVLATDIDLHCARSHSENFPGVPFFLGSVEHLTLSAIRSLVPEIDAGRLDLIAGGPPCPAFSKSRFYRKDKPRALADEDALIAFSGYFSMVEALRPRAFLLENVKGLTYGVHRADFDLIIAQAENLGYRCSWQVLNAADYGVPQIRERCFLVGVDGGPAFRFPEPTHAKDPSAQLLTSHLPPWEVAGDWIGELDTEENASDEGHFAGGQYHELLRQIPVGDNYLYFTERRGHPNPVFRWRSRYWSFLLKLSPDLPSWTIQARRSNNMGPFHWRNRILRIDEIKRLQTFPLEWTLSGTIEQQWRQIGNAVPPALAEALGAALVAHLRPIPEAIGPLGRAA